jgi:hypothetical protein
MWARLPCWLHQEVAAGEERVPSLQIGRGLEETRPRLRRREEAK